MLTRVFPIFRFGWFACAGDGFPYHIIVFLKLFGANERSSIRYLESFKEVRGLHERDGWGLTCGQVTDTARNAPQTVTSTSRFRFTLDSLKGFTSSLRLSLFLDKNIIQFPSTKKNEGFFFYVDNIVAQYAASTANVCCGKVLV